MEAPAQSASLARGLAWVLRLALLLQVCGAAVKYLFAQYEVETPVFGLLAFDWLWPEQRVQQIDDAAVWLNLACGVAVVILALGAVAWSRATGPANLLQRWMFVWQTPLLLAPLLFELALATASTIRLEGFQPPRYFTAGTLFESVEAWLMTDFASHAGRIALPVALLLLTPLPGKTQVSAGAFHAAMWLVRIAAALTFIAHGLKAVYLNFMFVDYILAASHTLLGYEMAQSTAETLLRIIGYVDLLVAALLVAGRFRSVAVYMAAWGLITAASRMVYGGGGQYFEVLIRGANYGLPLVAAIYFCWYHKHLSRFRSNEGEQDNGEETDGTSANES